MRALMARPCSAISAKYRARLPGISTVARGSFSAVSMSGVHLSAGSSSFSRISRARFANIQLMPGSLNWLAIVG